MISITNTLAQRLELAEAADGAACVEADWLLTPHSDAALKSVAGAYVMYAGPASPLTHVLGLGMCSPVTASDLEEIEDFYQVCQSPVVIDLCPHAHASLRELLTERDYKLAEFNNVMVKELKIEDEFPAITSDAVVRPAEPLDLEIYAETLTRAFFGRDQISQEELHLGRVIFSMPGARSFIAEIGDLPAGCGGMSMRRGVASLYGDATLPSRRRRNVHCMLIRSRLVTALEGGCDTITATTQPGSASQRNYERMGFQVAYTKTVMVLE